MLTGTRNFSEINLNILKPDFILGLIFRQKINKKYFFPNTMFQVILVTQLIY